MNIEDPSTSIDDPSIGIGTITFEGDSLIPIMKRVGALFGFNGFEPGVLPGRLVEVTVNRYKCIFHLLRIAMICRSTSEISAGSQPSAGLV
jgi:hypothetical protein